MSISKIRTKASMSVLTEREKEIFELIKKNPKLKASEIKKILSLSSATINSTLRSLKQKEYIKRSDLEERDEWVILK